MRFPLGDWIAQHSDVPHNLGLSGMRGVLRSTVSALTQYRPAEPDLLVTELARSLGVSASRVFPTHGATEANTLVLAFLRGLRPSSRVGPLRVRVAHPEYPVLTDSARVQGYRIVTKAPAEVRLMSRPNNPTGLAISEADCLERLRASERLVVDETFREFTTAPTLARSDASNVWVLGTFTKTYGADHIRVGYVVAPSAHRDAFERAQGVLADGIASASVGAAVTLLRHRAEILSEARRVFERNQKRLAETLGADPALSAPLWFDRGTSGLDGDLLSKKALHQGVLVCSGRFFGDPRGVRLCLTRRSFPADLDAYWRVRSAFLG